MNGKVRWFEVTYISLFILFAAFTAQGQDASVSPGASSVTPPLPLGIVSRVRATPCTAKYVPGASCFTATVSCPQMPDIGVTFGTHSGKSGTIVFLTGGGGTWVGGAGDAPVYQQHGFGIVQFAWNSNWEVGGNDLRAAACRPATMLNYFYTHGSGTPYCAQGMSAGSGALGYALAWYGLDARLDNAEMVVGPVFSSIVQGCEVPKAPSVRVIPTNGASFLDAPQYIGGEITSLTTGTGQQCQPSGSTSTAMNSDWISQQIVQSTAKLRYPNTSMGGWVCDNGLNPSAAQAYLFFSAVGSPWALTRLSGCTGAEGISTSQTPQHVPATTAVQADMLAQCVNRH